MDDEWDVWVSWDQGIIWLDDVLLRRKTRSVLG